MIPNETLQTIQTVGDTAIVGSFKITDATQARILVSLSDKMYTQKELAAIREYSTNAADAHIVAKAPTKNIVVTMPTLTDLNFKVRDYGTGLTEEQIRDVYCVFGESTKRNSPELNGVLGYGCKAGFASADTFTVTSWINGEKTVYQCIKGDSTKLHTALRLSRVSSDEPSGIEINIPVKSSSLWTFHREAADFYKYWPETPTLVNLTDDEVAKIEKFRTTAPTLQGEGWEVRPKSDSSARGVAYMGWVPYTINWNTLYHRMSLTSQKRVLFDLLQNNDVTLFFKMGEVQFGDNREGLEYTETTLNAVMARIEEIFSKIKESIQAKFDDCSNLWEAKKMYNAIFGTAILDLEKGEEESGKTAVERIKILDGNLITLERGFRGSFTWNGIALDSASFDQVNRFDNAQSSIGESNHYPTEPVLLTYRKKNLRAKSNRCKSGANNTIVASDHVVVVLNDTGYKTGQSMVARYFIFGSEKKVRTVHILSMWNPTIKQMFYDTYHFDTVPVVKLSEILPEAKKWNNANKVSRSYGGGGGGARPMEYMDIENTSIEESDVPVRQIEEGAYYVEIAESSRRNKRRVRMDGYATERPDCIINHIKTIVDKLDLDIDRVYIIGGKTKEAKWFKQAVEAGEWTNLWTFVKESIRELDVNALVDSENFNDSNSVCEEVAVMLTPKITNPNSPMLKLISIGSGKNHADNLEIINALEQLYFWVDLKGETTGTVDFATVASAAEASYPFLNFGSFSNNSLASEEFAAKVATYVNAMDLYVDVGTKKEVVAVA